jgi:alanyl-tRNA synthetase
LEKICGHEIGTDSDNIKSARIIADHLRAAVFMISDGVQPGNVDQSYVLRRLLRRSIMRGRRLGITNAFCAKIADVIVTTYSDDYPKIIEKAPKIRDEMRQEEEQFHKTLDNGAKEFEKFISRVPEHVQKKIISGKNAFYLYETYGFPVELTIEMASEKGFSVDMEGYAEAYKKHQELSRSGAEQKFKGGLADASEMTVKLHTATHLLHQALRMTLGKHVEQKGSNITTERLRFDFSHPEKLSDEELSKVQNIVNEIIQKNLPVKVEQKTVEEAINDGAIGLFMEKYGEEVKVYSIGDFSKEVCGGPHAESTGVLGKFKILKEESSSRGVRRIKASIE